LQFKPFHSASFETMADNNSGHTTPQPPSYADTSKAAPAMYGQPQPMSGQPMYGQPGQPMYGQLGQPMYGQLGQPMYPQQGYPGAPGQPEYAQQGYPGAAGQPGYAQPGQPMYGQPGQPGVIYGQPTQVVVVQDNGMPVGLIIFIVGWW
jgi:hypothetical protein